jgi:hypothetical protein
MPDLGPAYQSPLLVYDLMRELASTVAFKVDQLSALVEQRCHSKTGQELQEEIVGFSRSFLGNPVAAAFQYD